MKAEALARERYILAEDAYVDIAARRVPRSVKGSTHRVKYRLALVVAGECVLPYDNDTGKGDHRHVGAVGTPYSFSSYKQLLADSGPTSTHGENHDEDCHADVASREDVTQRALEIFRGKRQRARINFATPEFLWKVLTAKRWEVLKAMAGQGPLTIREVARRVERDVKAVSGDVHALLAAACWRAPTRTKCRFPLRRFQLNSCCERPDFASAYPANDAFGR
jgi:hypothetical protein